MGKKQLTALVIILVSFLLFFYKGFLDFSTASPFVNLFSFLALLAGTVAAIGIGNSGAR
tara:strand:- start:19669 stop:19845 length:177 start_codon:yes stop_codon:yes gene_type:complete